MSEIIYNLFGSKDSVDLDVIVFVDELPSSIEACKNTCNELEKQFHYLCSNTNCNLAVVKDGVIVKSFKGSPDEVNNSLFNTYNLWKQKYPCQVIKIVKRNVEVKAARALRSILTFISRTEYREKVKEALKGDIQKKIDVLDHVDFLKIDTFDKNGLTDADCWKGIAFQTLQTLALLHGKEIYTKEEARNYSGVLRNFLDRKEASNASKNSLNGYIRMLCWEIQEQLKLSEVKE